MSDRRYGPDEHNADYERGREDERAAIVAWLVGYGLPQVANHWPVIDIERGEHLHAGCHAALEAQAVEFRTALANERQRQTANARIGAELRYLLAPGVKRKTYRREMLEALVAAADEVAGR